MINKYNKMTSSIASQELAISKVRQQIEIIQDRISKNGRVASFKDSLKLDNLTQQLEIMENKLAESKRQANKTKKSISELSEKKFQLRGLDGVESGLENINKNVTKFGKRITGLIASAFIFNILSKGLKTVQESFVSLLKTDDDFSSSLNQIKANLMTAFAPIYNAALPAINSLMNAIAQLTGTIAQFVATSFGVSLKDATKQAKKLSGALDKTAKSGSKASGSLSSFDRLEVISESGGSSGAGGNTGGISDIDYSGEIEVNQKLLDFLERIKKFVVENKDMIIGFLFGVAAALLAIKLGCDLIMGLGIGLLVAGIVMSIKAIKDFLENPTWENFAKVLRAISLVLAGLAIIFGSIPLAVAAIIAVIVGLVIENWDTIKKILGIIGSWIWEHVLKPTLTFIKNTLETVWKTFTNFISILGGIIAAVFGIIAAPFQTAFEVVIHLLNNVKEMFKLFGTFFKQLFTGDIKGALNTFKNIFKNIFDSLWTIAKAPINLIINGINALIKGLNKVKFDVPSWVPVIGGNKLGFNIPTIPKLATGAVIPPRHEFAAILGDQKHGTNIETPLETMKDAFRDVINEFGGISEREKEIILKNLTIIAQFGTKTFQKLTMESIRLEEKETGTTLLLN